MELSYWRSKWRKGNIGFHMEDAYPGLEKQWNSISINEQSAVFVPLCGKSKDLIWLSERCEQVVGVEISELAVKQFLDENYLDATISSFADFKIYQTKNIELWNGDFFKLPEHKLPSFDLVYDKAALIALSPDMRQRYVDKILNLVSVNTQILLHHFVYQQSEMTGPPFSVSIDDINTLYGQHFNLQILEKQDLGTDYYKKFQNRGLRSYFIEILSLLLPNKEESTN